MLILFYLQRMNTHDDFEKLVEKLRSAESPTNGEIHTALSYISTLLTTPINKNGQITANIPTVVPEVFQAFRDSKHRYDFTENVIIPGKNLSFVQFRINTISAPTCTRLCLHTHGKSTLINYTFGGITIDSGKDSGFFTV